MRVDTLITRLTEDPDDLMRELIAKREVMILAHKEQSNAITNIGKVIRVARDSAARQRRNDTEIEALEDALIGQGETIDLSNLYLDNLESLAQPY
tara:strand:+ start:18664 stop:18948 length:285 start_codon:yes stop_codon:yes gene_type:complete